MDKNVSRHRILADWGWFSSSVMGWFYQQAFWKKKGLIWHLPVSTVYGSVIRIHLQCRIRGRSGFDPWVGKIPWRRKWQPNQYSCWEKSHGQRSLVDCRPWGCKESDTTEQLNIYDINALTMVNFKLPSSSCQMGAWKEMCERLLWAKWCSVGSRHRVLIRHCLPIA